MNTLKAGSLVVINLPANRRGKINTIHGRVGIVVVESRVKWKEQGIVTTIKLLNPEGQKVHVRKEHIIEATPETHPELYI